MKDIDRPHHRVSCKAALFTEDSSQVLMVQQRTEDIKNRVYSLPGGHLEHDETPDHAIYRELGEELGINPSSITDMERRDFFVHRTGKIILGYMGTLERTTHLKPDYDEISHADWVDVIDIDHITVPDSGYLRFVHDCIRARQGSRKVK